LEAAVYGHPVIFGPNYHKFSEAIGLVESRGGYSYATEADLKNIVLELLNDDEKLISSGKAAGKLVKENIGATNKIMNWIKENVF
jgi:3-deoxy-D-manno-octulosonic-acid transferase